MDSSFVIVFLIVRSGEQVSEHEGGESVVCIMTGGFEPGLPIEWNGVSFDCYYFTLALSYDVLVLEYFWM